MNDNSSLNHSRLECKYHIVWKPKYRRKTLYGQPREYLGQIFKDLAKNIESGILEGHMLPDHAEDRRLEQLSMFK